MQGIKCIFIVALLSFLAAPALSTEKALSPGVPDMLPNSIDLVDETGQDLGAPFPSVESLERGEYQEEANTMLASWFDSGSGPGTLEYQYLLYTSDLLSSSFASGYMTSISYNWSGSFNGWSDTFIYLLIVDPNGNIVANADVTESTSGTVSAPASTYPADYRVAFGYIVDRSPQLRIYNGPSFGSVNVTVQYN